MEERNTSNRLQIGPRMKSKATIALENFIKELVNPENWDNTRFEFNPRNELVCYIKEGNNEKFFSVAQIFKNRPDFEHLEFDAKTLANVQRFLKKQSQIGQLAIKKIKKNAFPRMTDAEKRSINAYTDYYFTIINDSLRKKGMGPTLKLEDFLKRQHEEDVSSVVSSLKLYEFNFPEFKFVYIPSSQIKKMISSKDTNINSDQVFLTEEGNIYKVIDNKIVQVPFTPPLSTQSKDWLELTKEFKKKNELTSPEAQNLLDKIICNNPQLKKQLNYESVEQRLNKSLTFLSRDWLITSVMASHGLAKEHNETQLYLAKDKSSIQLHLNQIQGDAVILVPTSQENQYDVYSVQNKNEVVSHGVIDITHKTIFTDAERFFIKETENKNKQEGVDFVWLERDNKNYQIVDDLISSVKNELIHYSDCDLIQWDQRHLDSYDVFSRMHSDYAYVINGENIYFADKANKTYSLIELSKDYLLELMNQFKVKSNQAENTESTLFLIRKLTGNEIDDIVMIQKKELEDIAAKNQQGIDVGIPPPIEVKRPPPQFNTKQIKFNQTEKLYRVEAENPYMKTFIEDIKENIRTKGYKIHSYDAFLSTSTNINTQFGGEKPIITIYEHPIGHGKPVKDLSSAEKEQERLFPPGTQVLIDKVEETDKEIHIYAKLIRSLDNAPEANAYSKEHIAIREKFINMKDQLPSLLEKIKDPDYKRRDSRYHQALKEIPIYWEEMINLLAKDHSSPEVDRHIIKLNLAIYNDFLILNQQLPPDCNFIKELMPVAYKLNDAIIQHKFTTQRTDVLDTMKYLVQEDLLQYDLVQEDLLQYDLLQEDLLQLDKFQNIDEWKKNRKSEFTSEEAFEKGRKSKFRNEYEIVLHQCLTVFSIYSNLLTKFFGSPTFFGQGSTLASDIRMIMKKTFDIDLPEKLNSKSELEIKCSPRFNEITNTTLNNFAINPLTSVEDSFKKILQSSSEAKKPSIQ